MTAGRNTSWAPARFISSRMMRAIFCTTRQPSGRKEYMPAATLRRYPPRTIKMWDGTSASAGASFRVGTRVLESRIAAAS